MVYSVVLLIIAVLFVLVKKKALAQLFYAL